MDSSESDLLATADSIAVRALLTYLAAQQEHPERTKAILTPGAGGTVDLIRIESSDTAAITSIERFTDAPGELARAIYKLFPELRE